MNDPGARTGGGLSRATAVVLGALGGLAIGLLMSGFLSFFAVKHLARKARAGWNLVPVVVAATDIPESTVVTLDVISQRMVPEQFVTSSVVRPEQVSYIVSQKALVPLQAGDLLLWSQIETKKLPVVLAAAADIPAGAVISEKDLAEKAMPEDLLTPSFVRTRDRPQVVGRPVIAPFRKGDPILWTHFKAGNGH